MTNKGGRPLEGSEPKNAPIAVRTTATLKATLQDAAQREGRSITQEIERRLARSIADDALFGDDAQAELLRKIVADIRAMEALTKKRWHKDLVTWAAVAEALANGAIVEMRPDRADDDDEVNAAWDKLWEILEKKRPLLDLLARYGVKGPINESEVPSFKGSSNPLLAALSPRWAEHGAVAALEVSHETKETLAAAINDLALLDEAERQANNQFAQAVQPFQSALTKGREVYDQHRERVRRERAALAGVA